MRTSTLVFNNRTFLTALNMVCTMLPIRPFPLPFNLLSRLSRLKPRAPVHRAANKTPSLGTVRLWHSSQPQYRYLIYLSECKRQTHNGQTAVRTRRSGGQCCSHYRMTLSSAHTTQPPCQWFWVILLHHFLAIHLHHFWVIPLPVSILR